MLVKGILLLQEVIKAMGKKEGLLKQYRNSELEIFIVFHSGLWISTVHKIPGILAYN